MKKPLFNLGNMYATPGAREALEANDTTGVELIHRHVTGDWGDLSEGDQHLNDLAIEHEGDLEQMSRVFSAYNMPDGSRIWIITEADRSSTTLLRPHEY